MESRTYVIRGIAPQIQHNSQLADPLNKWAKAIKEITSKRKKTDADHEEIARREFMGSLYLVGKNQVPGWPSANLERMLRDAGKHLKLGSTIQNSLIVVDDAEIEYDGPKDPDKMWAHGGFSIRASAKVGTSRTLRTRPCFQSWQVTFTVQFDEERLNTQQVDDIVDLAGKYIGLSDWRPRYGRFEIVSAA